MGEILFADAIHIRAQAEIKAKRITQASGNERRGAESSLQRFSASLANSRALDTAGSNINDITGNIARNLDAASAGKFQSRVAAAEELGASVAMASAAGVGGSTIDAYNATMRLNRSMREEQADRAVKSDLSLASASRGNQIKAAVSGFDNNVYNASQDFTQYVDHKKMGIFTQVLAVGATAAATYFGGPQAGAAVIGMFEANQQAANGDLGAASNSIMGAVKNGFGAAKTTASMGEGGYWGSTKQAQSLDEPVITRTRSGASMHI